MNNTEVCSGHNRLFVENLIHIFFTTEINRYKIHNENKLG